jgi:hypothetical protein
VFHGVSFKVMNLQNIDGDLEQEDGDLEQEFDIFPIIYCIMPMFLKQPSRNSAWTGNEY